MTYETYAALSKTALAKVSRLPVHGWFAEDVLSPREGAASMLESFMFQMAGNGPGGYVGNGYAFQPGPRSIAAHRIVAGLITDGRNLDPDLADASLSALRLFAGCKDMAEMDALRGVADEAKARDEDAACEAFYKVFERDRAFAFMDGILAKLPKNADLAEFALDLDPSTLPMRKAADPSAPPIYSDVMVKVDGKKPLVMIERVQAALLKANLGKEAYRFRAEAASGKETVEDVVRRWVSTDLPPIEAEEDEPSGPAF